MTAIAFANINPCASTWLLFRQAGYWEERSLSIEGETPVLKSGDALPVDRAVSAMEKLGCTNQQIYLEDGFDKYQGTFFRFDCSSGE